MRKLLGVAIGAVIGFLTHKLYKEFVFLHRVAVDTMDVNNKMEILYSRCLEILIANDVTDKEKLTSICDTLVTGFRPNLKTA